MLPIVGIHPQWRSTVLTSQQFNSTFVVSAVKISKATIREDDTEAMSTVDTCIVESASLTEPRRLSVGFNTANPSNRTTPTKVIGGGNLAAEQGLHHCQTASTVPRFIVSPSGRLCAIFWPEAMHYAILQTVQLLDEKITKNFKLKVVEIGECMNIAWINDSQEIDVLFIQTPLKIFDTGIKKQAGSIFKSKQIDKSAVLQSYLVCKLFVLQLNGTEMIGVEVNSVTGVPQPIVAMQGGRLLCLTFPMIEGEASEQMEVDLLSDIYSTPYDAWKKSNENKHVYSQFFHVEIPKISVIHESVQKGNANSNLQVSLLVADSLTTFLRNCCWDYHSTSAEIVYENGSAFVLAGDDKSVNSCRKLYCSCLDRSSLGSCWLPNQLCIKSSGVRDSRGNSASEWCFHCFGRSIGKLIISNCRFPCNLSVHGITCAGLIATSHR